MKGYDKYSYSGRTIVLDKHHDKYEMDFQSGDVFFHAIKNGVAHIVHEADQSVVFTAKLKDRKYVSLMRNAESADPMNTPHPKFPAYPMLTKITMELVPKLYAYYNEKYFNNKCPKHVLFKQTRSKSTFGLATLKSQALRDKSDFYKLSVNLSNIANDPILFIDTLLHEMIHLYLYKLGLDTNDVATLNDGHGPRFHAEMRRINAHGFNISPTLSWEKRQDVHDTDIYFVQIHIENYMKLYWTEKNIERNIDVIYASITKRLAENATIEFRVTQEATVRNYQKLPDSLKLSEASFKKTYPTKSFKGRLIRSIDHKPSTKALVIPKSLLPVIVQPFSFFRSAAKTDNEHAYALWMSVKSELVLKHIYEKLEDAHHALDIGMQESEVRRRLNYVYSCAEGRISHEDYVNRVRKYLRANNMDVLLHYRELKL